MCDRVCYTCELTAIGWCNTQATDGSVGWTMLVEVYTDPAGSGLLALFLAAPPDFPAAVYAWNRWRAAALDGAVYRLVEESLLRIHMQHDE